MNTDEKYMWWKNIIMDRKIYVLFIFFIFFYMYITALSPSFNSDDSPETILAMHTLGVQHPPGYPLNTILGKIMLLIPAGSIMFRANLFSALLNILASFFIYLLSVTIVRKIGNKDNRYIHEAAALFAAAMYIFSSTPWLQGINAKGSIYSLNALLVSASMYYLININRSPVKLYMFLFLYGLGFSNHWTSVIVLTPAVLIYLIWQRRSFSLKNLLTGSFFFFLGITPYMFVLIRSNMEPAYAWGDIKTFKDFIWLISRAQYAGVETKHTVNDTLNLLGYYLKNFSGNEFPFFSGLLLIPGFFIAFRRSAATSVLLFVSYISIIFGVSMAATPPPNTEWLTKPYLVSSNIFVAVFSSIFIFHMFTSKNKVMKYVSFFGAAIILSGMILMNRPDYDRYFIGYDYSRNISKTAGSNSIVFAEGDMNVGAVLYETLVSKKDYSAVIPVVILYDWYQEQIKRNYSGMITVPGKADSVNASIKSIITANSGKKMFYTITNTEQFVSGLSPVPAGLLNIIKLDGGPVVITDNYLKTYSYRGVAFDKVHYDEFTERLVSQNYATAFFKLGDIFRMNKSYRSAIKFYKRGMLFYKNDGGYINLGLCYYSLGDMDNALLNWNEAVMLNPLSSVAYSNIAFIYMAKNNKKSALEYIDKALELDNNNQTAIQLKNQIITTKSQ